MARLTDIERGQLIKLFNRGGYVLNFSTADFDTFTSASIGVAVCAHYNMSKGKSLLAYLEEAPAEKAEKLLSDLFVIMKKNLPRNMIPMLQSRICIILIQSSIINIVICITNAMTS